MSDEKKETDPTLSEKIEIFERFVSARDFENSISQLRKVFSILETGKEGFGKQLGRVNAAAEQEATCLAAAITNFLTDAEFTLTRTALIMFGQYKRVLSHTFEVSGYRGTAHFIRLFGEKHADGNITFKGRDVPKLFCGLSLNALTEPLLNLFLRQKPDVSWPLVNGFLSEQVLWSPTAEVARSKILASGKHWENIPVTTQLVRNFGPAYMGCSYADAPHKHDIKASMNVLVRRWLEEQGVTDIAEPAGGRRGVKRKPTLIVMAELYNSTHAMHRCYGPAIRSLKDRFKLIYMSAEGKCDEKLHYMFDKIDDTKFEPANPKSFFDKAKSYRPDVVYYPSVGMRFISLLGSNLRLAPVQVMTYGHPATTNSPFIDYSMIVEGLIGDEDTISDTILYWSAARRYEVRPDAEPMVAAVRKDPEVVRIAVPAWSRKITPRFLAVCQRIQREASKPVEFYFFPNGVGSLFQAVKRRVGGMMRAKIFPRTNYNSYINTLGNCDIFLSTFPFGATNGILDAGPLGLPIVNLKGPEVHAINDSEMVSCMKQPEWLSADTVDGYVQAVLRLIKNNEERVAISQSNARFDYDAEMMVSPDDSCEPFGVAVEAAYRNHEKLQNAGVKSWSYANLQRL